MSSDNDIVQTKTTRRARRLLKLISALTGQSMQTEAERVFEEEVKRLQATEPTNE